MAETSRIEELRRRVQRDPASIAFAQLAEEYRRAGRYKEAIETCESGLAHHPGYLSARVTLGRSLLEIGELDAAQLELKQVLRAAPENLAALRGLAEIHHRRGELREALAHYRAALDFARHDPELEHIVEQITKELEPQASTPVVVDGMSFEEAKDAFLNLSLPDPPEETPAPSAADDAPAAPPVVLQEAVTEPVAVADPPVDTNTTSEAGAPPASAHVADDVEDVPAAVTEPTPASESRTAAEPEVPTEAVIVTEPSGPIEPVGVMEVNPSFAEAQSLDVTPPELEFDPSAFPSLAMAAAADPVPIAEGQGAVSAVPSPACVVGQASAAGAAQVDALERWLDVILAERQRRG